AVASMLRARDKLVFRIREGIDNRKALAFDHHSSDDRPASHFQRVRIHECYELARIAVARNLSVDVAGLSIDRRHIGVAKPGSRFYKGVEHGLQIEGRAADYFKHVGGGGLLLQRFAQLVEQPRVLDGDDCLGRKILYQRDLFVSERTELLAIEHDCADQLVVLEHRYAYHRSRAAHLHQLDGLRVAFKIDLLSLEIGNMDDRLGGSEAGERERRVADHADLRLLPPTLGESRLAVHGDGAEAVPLP